LSRRRRLVPVVARLSPEAEAAVLAGVGRVAVALVQLHELDRVPRRAAACAHRQRASGSRRKRGIAGAAEKSRSANPSEGVSPAPTGLTPRTPIAERDVTGHFDDGHLGDELLRVAAVRVGRRNLRFHERTSEGTSRRSSCGVRPDKHGRRRRATAKKGAHQTHLRRGDGQGPPQRSSRPRQQRQRPLPNALHLSAYRNKKEGIGTKQTNKQTNKHTNSSVGTAKRSEPSASIRVAPTQAR
jgi:hypothetical protein